MVPSPDAATGASTKVASLSVAAIPSARGNREAGTSWLSTARRYPEAAPLTDPATAASTISQVKDASYAASKAIDARANVRMITSTFRTVAKGRLLPSRAIGMAPTTWASVMASIMAAPPLVSPVRLRATSEKAIGPAACGTPRVADEMNQRSSGHRLGRSEDRTPPPLVWSLWRLAIVNPGLLPVSAAEPSPNCSVPSNE